MKISLQIFLEGMKREKVEEEGRAKEQQTSLSVSDPHVSLAESYLEGCNQHGDAPLEVPWEGRTHRMPSPLSFVLLQLIHHTHAFSYFLCLSFSLLQDES